MDETDHVRERYARRNNAAIASLYKAYDPSVYMSAHEKECALLQFLRTFGMAPLEDKRVLEIGCGTGSNLLQLIQWGFHPGNLVGNELLEERARKARYRLPDATRVLVGDAAELPLEEGEFDIVYQSTVFTSILDASFQRRLANRVWDLTRVGGGVLWYDFIFDNPNNPDVRGISVGQIRELFPMGKLTVRRLTLAPPISRKVSSIHPSLYSLFNAFPFLRTHVLCWIEKLA